MKSGIKLKVLNLDDGDGFIHYKISVSNGQAKSELEFYDYFDTFKEFGERLCGFPQKITDKIEFQVGEDDKKYYNYLHLEVYCFEPNGQSALKAIIDNHGPEPYYERSEFSIRTLPATLNKFGQGLKNWNPYEEFEFTWEA